jgi:serine/threonine-protein kinase RsbW
MDLSETVVVEMTDHSREILLSIPSSDRFVYLVDLVISYVSKEMQFDEETTEQVNLAVIEAGTNAIKHGNKSDPEKMADFRFHMEKDKLTVFIKDYGSGFDPENVGDPLSPENFMKPSGRGIFLMRAFMDEVEYNVNEGHGTEVRLVKYKNSHG